VTRAIIYVPPVAHMFMYADQCFRAAAAKGYDVGDRFTNDWRQAVAIIRASDADVLLYAREEHLDPRRKPRAELAAPDDVPFHPRTRPIRRGAGA
jgi:hypothetical protein